MLLSIVDACRRVPGGAKHLVTRETGQAVRAVLARELEALPANGILILDFSEVGVVDYSCADECLAKLVTRLVAGEYGDKYVLLQGLGESQRENVQVALERKRLAAIVVHADRRWDCLGIVVPHLRETLNIVMTRAHVSARDLVGMLDLALTTASTRLGSLHRQRLVSRRERTVDEGGREFVYEGLVQSAGMVNDGG